MYRLNLRSRETKLRRSISRPGKWLHGTVHGFVRVGARDDVRKTPNSGVFGVFKRNSSSSWPVYTPHVPLPSSWSLTFLVASFSSPRFYLRLPSSSLERFSHLPDLKVYHWLRFQFPSCRIMLASARLTVTSHDIYCRTALVGLCRQFAGPQ